MKICRICKSNLVKEIAEYKPYLDHHFRIYDCYSCGCRFANREYEISDGRTLFVDPYEFLYNQGTSTFSGYSIIAQKAKEYFDSGDTHQLYRLLSRTAKFKFIIDRMSKISSDNNSILEVGCSTGFLTSYFILLGYDIIGVDISPTAIGHATRYFGNHFETINGDYFSPLGKFDAIFHAGTIGCVNDPIKTTNSLLDILKLNGRLLFNAPNLQAIVEMNLLWVETPPPDVITIFPESFWYKYFMNDKTNVEITYEPYDHTMNLYKYIYKKFAPPNPELIHPRFSTTLAESGLSRSSNKAKIVEYFTINLLRCISYFSKFILPPRYASEYGMFIEIEKSL